jgi:malonate decarboxylase delta subunit
MEELQFEFKGKAPPTTSTEFALAGVVSSGNLEVMIEKADLGGSMRIVVNTAAVGFGDTWRAVLADFSARHPLGDVLVTINDAGATPAVVSLRLDQTVEEFQGDAE